MFNSKGIGVMKACIYFLTPVLDSFGILTKLRISLCSNFLIINILIIVPRPQFIVTFKRNKSGGVLSGQSGCCKLLYLVTFKVF